MTVDAPVLLSDLLDDMRHEVDKAVNATTETEPARDLIRKAIDLLPGAVEQGVRAACRIDLGKAIGTAWGMAGEIIEACDPAHTDPEANVSVALAKHPVTIAIDPKLTLKVHGLPDLPLKLIVEFVATVNAAVVVVHGGGIIDAKLGTIGLSAKLRCHGLDVPLPLKQRTVDLPLAHHFDPAIVLRHADHAA